MKFFCTVFYTALLGILAGCSSAPEPEPVENFELQKYLGKWYEIARLPAPFEKDLTKISTVYTLKENTLFVENSGYKEGRLRIMRGRAHFVGKPDSGLLRVSFFRPFYGDYRIIYLEKDYSAAIVCSGKKYLWILSRSEKLPYEKLRTYLAFIRKAGFDTGKLIWRK